MNPQDSQSELDAILFRFSVGKIDESMGNIFPKEVLDKARQDVMDNDPEYKIARDAIEAYVTTRVKEAERLARLNQAINDLEAMQDGDTDYEWVLDNQRYEVKRLEALTTTTNGKGE